MPSAAADAVKKTLARSPWVRRGTIFAAPELEAAGLAHGLTTAELGAMREAELRREVCGAAGLPDPVYLTQVHGVSVLQANYDFNGSEADGWITDQPGLPLAVFAADCLPVILSDRAMKRLAVVHAGWRGLEAGILERAISGFGKLGAEAGQLRCWIGPHIQPCCYEVGSEFRLKSFRPESLELREGKLRLDLAGEAAARLVSAGLPAPAVSASSDCTACRPKDFLSFRRDGVKRSMMAFAALPGEGAR